MSGKPLNFTRHALGVIKERKINELWVQNTVRFPDWIEIDPGGNEVERRFRTIQENGSRILRVICIESEHEVRIISTFFDRRARKPK